MKEENKKENKKTKQKTNKKCECGCESGGKCECKCCKEKDLKIEEGTNRIDLNIPAIDNWFFARYHVIDEFVYIKGNKIHWHGKVYEKE